MKIIKIYLLEDCPQYECGGVIGVFGNLADAEKEKEKREKKGNKDLYITEWDIEEELQ